MSCVVYVEFCVMCVVRVECVVFVGVFACVFVFCLIDCLSL